MLNRLASIFFLAAAFAFVARAAENKTYATPEEARDALLQAAKKGLDELRALFGANSAEIVRTGDDVFDKQVLQRFNELAAEKAQLESEETNPDEMSLVIGAQEWPFAVPLVREAGRWYWDVEEGRAEIRRRTIGRNELNAIEISRGYVEAQEIYAETDWENRGILTYAKKIVSSPGKKDGLFWPGDDSPVAEGFAKAVAEGYSAAVGSPKPYHGYFYKILMAQGPDAPGGAQNYLVKNLMIGGFALVAWPARYGDSGIMTFIVNQDGVVYEKNLGLQSASIAKAMTRFNPDKTWRAVPDDTTP